MTRLLPLVLLAACAAVPAKDAPLPAAAAVVIEGNQAVSAADLSVAAAYELKAFAAHGRRPADAEDAAYAMEVRLRAAGFAHGKVAFAVEPERVLFTVEEGPRVVIGSLSFEGVAGIPLAEARAYFDFEGSGPLGSGSALYRAVQLQEAVENLEYHYLEEGFYRVLVKEPLVTFRDGGAQADVLVPVVEGIRYTVEAVQGDLPAALDLQAVGRPYHVRVPARIRARVRGHWLAQGYQFAKVDVVAERDDATGAVRITVSVEAGEQVHLGRVVIGGNLHTKERFLRRRVEIEDGEVIFQKELNEAIDDLYRTRLFTAVRPRLEPRGPDLADLRIDLEELKARSVDFELGYGSYELARGAVRYRDRNLFGIGRRLQAEGRISLRSYGADLRIEDPWIFGSKTTLELATGYGVREEPSFDRETVGFSIAARHKLKGGPLTLRAGYRFRAEKATDVIGAIAPAEEAGFLRTAGLFASLQRDTRDDFLFPGSGSVTQIGALWSSPSLGADLDFFELGLSGSWYFPLAERKRTVLAFGFRFTSREILDDRLTLPIQERLFLGGESSVRSFLQDELGPSDAQGDPVGGLTAAEAFLELRRHIWRDLYGAVFYDVGMVDPAAFTVQGPPGHAVGAGLRYLLPVGPIRLDIAYNPGRLFAAGSRWGFHLAIGFSF